MSGTDDRSTALPQTCVRCKGLALVRIVGRCANCIADMGLNHLKEHQAWHEELTKLVKGK